MRNPKKTNRIVGEAAKGTISPEQKETHREVRNSRYQAARLEGKVQNRGIKNLGRNARKHPAHA